MSLDERDHAQYEIDRAPIGEPPLDPPEICDVCNEVDCECLDPDDYERVDPEDFWAEVILADRAADADSDWADL